MGFFSNLKTATSESIKAVNHGAELFSEAASSLESATDIWVIESKINRLEGDIDRALLGEYCRYKLKRMAEELDELYQELSEKADSGDIVRVRERRARLYSRVHQVQMDSFADDIHKTQAALQHRTFLMPVDYKRELEWLKSDVEDLLGMLPASKQGMKQKYERQQKQLAADIQRLELQRYTEEFDYYLSGSKKSVLRRRDSKLNGDSEEWYENGMRKQLAQFSNGKCDGQFFCWRDDGSLIVQAIKNRSTGERVQTIYLENGTIVCVVRFESSKNGHMKIWLWNGIYLGKACINHGSVERGGFFFQMLFRPLVWMSVFKACKYKADRDGLENLVEATRHWEASTNVIDRMQDIDKNPKVF
jgi:antitoxin component YwqK of YwqJK toxin-antitoxin module